MQKHNGKHGHYHHMWMMLICCLLPVAVLLVFTAKIGNTGSGTGWILNSLLSLLCPLMMVLMMLMHSKKDNKADGQEEKVHLK